MALPINQVRHLRMVQLWEKKKYRAAFKLVDGIAKELQSFIGCYAFL